VLKGFDMQDGEFMKVGTGHSSLKKGEWIRGNKDWRLRRTEITNFNTGETRRVEGVPHAVRDISSISFDDFMKRCSIAFASGVWPDN
jgi:hypothetical protein